MSDDETFEDDEEDYDLGYYEGDRNDLGERHGTGKAHLPNGDTYEGEYSHGKRHGQGFYKYQSGARYTGNYSAGQKHGAGTMLYPDGSKYEGTWTRNKKQGQGIYTYVNGDVYDGFWVEDVRHGPGNYKFEETGLTVLGKFVEGKWNGPVRILYEDHTFKGRYEEATLKGPGKFIFPKQEIEQIGNYVIAQVVERKEVEDDDYFMPVDKISIWKPMGIQPIVDNPGDGEEQEESLQVIDGVENQPADGPGEEADKKEEEPEEERPFQPQAERPDEPQTELYAQLSEPNSVEIVD